MNNFFKKIFLIFICFIASISSAATLSLSPSASTINVGDTVSINVIVNSSGANINAVSGNVVFPKDILTATSVSYSPSIINFWAKNPSVTGSGAGVSFEGVILSPGFTGSYGKVITIKAKALKSGTANISFNNGSVLANDGMGTDVFNTSYPLSISIIKPATNTVAEPVIAEVTESPITLTSTSHPDSTLWYNTKIAELQWTLPSDATGVAMQIDHDKDTNPNTFGKVVSKFTSSSLSDGIWYFHLVVKTKDKKIHKSIYTINIDTTAPSVATLRDDTVAKSPLGKLYIDVLDELSGIKEYSISVDGNEAIRLDTLTDHNYEIRPKDSGEHVAIISITDNAGNVRTGTLKFVTFPSATSSFAGFFRNIKRFFVNNLSVINFVLTLICLILIVYILIQLRKVRQDVEPMPKIKKEKNKEKTEKTFDKEREIIEKIKADIMEVEKPARKKK